MRELRYDLDDPERQWFLNQIDIYRSKYLFPPQKDWDADEFKIRCSELAAIDHLEELIVTNPRTPCFEILDELMSEVDICVEEDIPGEVVETLQPFRGALEELWFYLNNFAE